VNGDQGVQYCNVYSTAKFNIVGQPEIIIDQNIINNMEQQITIFNEIKSNSEK